MSYIARIQQHVQHRPDAAALSHKTESGWQTWVWRDVWQQVEQIAAEMHREGLQRGDRVAIFAENSPQWTLVDLACLYLGVVSVPIYATSSPDQVRYILEHAGCRLMFADGELLSGVTPTLAGVETLAAVIRLTPGSDDGISLATWLQRHSPVVPPVYCRSEELYTLVYTSGTTGHPKGVMLTHGNLMGTMTSHLASLTFNEGERSLAVLPLSHVFERGWTAIVLYAGGHNHYLSEINRLAEYLTEVKPHVFCAVPRIFEKIHAGIFQKANAAGGIAKKVLFLAERWNRDNQQRLASGHRLSPYRKSLQALAKALVGRKIKKALGGQTRFIPCGGAALDADIHGFFMGLGINLKIGYGLTETMATVSFMPDHGYRLGTLGRPMPGIEIKISPEDGEILVRSPSMTVGYYNDPDATAVLIRDGWLHTGDAGHLDDDGNLVFRERLKELMKTSGGKYIAPQHVEGVIARDALVEQVAVIADARNYATALIVPAWESLEARARAMGIRFTDRLDLVRHADIVAYFEQQLATLQAHLPRYERVKRFTLLAEPFTVEGGEITPTLKLKRRVIVQRFKDEIEAMYRTG